MYNHDIHTHFNDILRKNEMDIAGKDNLFYTRIIANAAAIYHLYMQLYIGHPKGTAAFDELIETIINAYRSRSTALKERDAEKAKENNWFLSNKLTGMSLYVDRFCGSLQQL